MSMLSATRIEELYGREYYAHGCGPVPYERSEHWLFFFARAAEELIRGLNPKRVLDAGCAMGFLVEAFWDRGVFCEGIDISEYAISQVRRDMAPYCKVRSITEQITERYDLITCIEVLEHLPAEQAKAAVENLCFASDTILFSSTPNDLSEPTHVNVQPTMYWLELFEQFGFLPSAHFDASFVVPHAMLLRKTSLAAEDFLQLFSEYLRYKFEFAARGDALLQFEKELRELRGIRDEFSTLSASRGALDEALRQSALFESQLHAAKLRSAEAQLAHARFRIEAERRIAGAEAAARRGADAWAAEAIRERIERETKMAAARVAAAEARATTAKRAADQARAHYEELRGQLAEADASQQKLSGELQLLRTERNSLVNSRAWRWSRPIATALDRVRRPIRVILTRGTQNGGASADRGIEHNLQLIRKSNFFDESWYRRTYPDITADLDAAEHYFRFGAAEGRNPGPDFDGNLYLQEHLDVASSGMNPLLHYIEFGSREGRGIQPVDAERIAHAQEADNQPEALRRALELIRNCSLFDCEWYCEHYPDVAALQVDAAVHYLRHGGTEGRNPGPEFDSSWYLHQYPDVASAGYNPLLHYIEYGSLEGREVRPAETGTPSEAEESKVSPEMLRHQTELIASSPLFNQDWYYKQYPDVAAAKMDATVHYLRFGAAEGRNPGPDFDGNWYLEANPDVAAAGLNPLLHYLEYGVNEARAKRPARTLTAAAGSRIGPMANQAIAERFLALTPIRVFITPRVQPRITMITDSISKGSLYGGVGTALLLSTLVAERSGASLRVITRSEAPDVSKLNEVLSINGVEWHDEVEFLHTPHTGLRELPLAESDFFLSTSWWTTHCLRESVGSSRIAYLLQEDERMFYPFGDDRLRCEEVLSSPDIRFLINTELLFEHLTTGTEALRNIRERGFWFEPAFPDSHYFPETTNRKPGTKRNLFFYARPQNPRNLYWRGLEALSAAIEDGTLPADEWNFYFVGRDLDNIILPRNVTPVILENLPWAEYAALVRQMDLGFCLMDTPHPSYPVLDLAACGAVVVTNRRGLKRSLTRYSDNIFCSEASVDNLKADLGQATRLAVNEEKRFKNYRGNRMLRDWRVALDPAVEHVIKLIGGRES